MMTYQDAKELVLSDLLTWEQPENPLIIIEDATLEFFWGWIFFYDSQIYYYSNDKIRDSIFSGTGNYPFIVDKSKKNKEYFVYTQSTSFYIAVKEYMEANGYEWSDEIGEYLTQKGHPKEIIAKDWLEY
jgi:hypothetical protein